MALLRRGDSGRVSIRRQYSTGVTHWRSAHILSTDKTSVATDKQGQHGVRPPPVQRTDRQADRGGRGGQTG